MLGHHSQNLGDQGGAGMDAGIPVERLQERDASFS